MKKNKTETTNEFGTRVLLSRIAEHRGYVYNPVTGLVNIQSKTLVANDPHTVAKLLLGQMTTKDDLLTVESITNIISKLADYSAIVEPVKNVLLDEGIKIPETTGILSNKTGTVEWFRQMMDQCTM